MHMGGFLHGVGVEGLPSPHDQSRPRDHRKWTRSVRFPPRGSEKRELCRKEHFHKNQKVGLGTIENGLAASGFPPEGPKKGSYVVWKTCPCKSRRARAETCPPHPPLKTTGVKGHMPFPIAGRTWGGGSGMSLLGSRGGIPGEILPPLLPPIPTSTH